MSIQTHIGLKVFDKGNTDDPRITPADFTGVGFPIKSRRGIPNKAVLLGSKAELYARYGSIQPDYNGVLALGLMYDNMRPYNAKVWVSRVVSSADDDVSAFNQVLTSTTKFVYAPSALAITLDGAGEGIEITAGTNLDEVTIVITGTLNALPIIETYTDVKATSIVAAINNGIGGFQKSKLVRVAQFSGLLPDVIPQTIVDPVLGLEITAIFNDGAIDTFTNSAGTTLLSEANNVYTAVAQSATTGAGVNATFTISRDSAGDIDTITITDAGTGYIVTEDLTIDGGDIGGVSTTDDITITVSALALTPKIAKVYGGQYGYEDPGSWANDYGFKVNITDNTPDQRDIIVYQKVSGEWVQVGTAISGLNINNQFSKIALESGYLYVPTVSGAGLLDPTPAIVPLSGGVDSPTPFADSDTVGVQANSTGFYAFDSIKISHLILVEEYDDMLSMAESLDFYLEANKQDVLGHINVNASKIALTSMGWASLLRSKSWICSYLGYQGVDDGFGGVREIPAIASFYGRGFIKKMFDDSGLPSVSPAGYPSAISGAKYITTQQLSDGDLLFVTKDLGINALQDIDGVGIIMRTSRTMSTDNVQYDIHRRRSINFLGNSFQQSLGWIEQLPNTPDVRRRFVLAQYFFLQEMYNNGMFKKDKGFEGAVKIQCDDQNNPETQVAQRILQCDTTVAIVDTIETATLNLISKDRVLTVNS